MAVFALASGICRALPNDRGSFADGLAEARKDKKVLGVYFDNPASSECLLLKLKLIGTDRFAALTKGDLVYLMIQDRGVSPTGDRLLGDEYLQLENYLKVTSFPTFVLFTYDGKMIDRIEGFNAQDDAHGDKYFDRLQAAIAQAKAQVAANPGAVPGTQGVNLLSAAKEAASQVRIYDGDVTFLFRDGAKLISHRTIQVTNDPTAVKLDCTDFFEKEPLKKYVSKLVMIGVTKGNTFTSTNQACVKSDFDQWLSENIKVEFSADGATAALTSVYHNKTGDVLGSGVLKLEP